MSVDTKIQKRNNGSEWCCDSVWYHHIPRSVVRCDDDNDYDVDDYEV